jgi:hypothetical protein
VLEEISMNKFTLDFTDYEQLQHLEGSLDRYLNHGIMPGGFLTAVLENNLSESFSRADHINSMLVKDIVQFLYNRFPMGAWGSPERVNDWVKFVKENKQKSEVYLCLNQ